MKKILLVLVLLFGITSVYAKNRTIELGINQTKTSHIKYFSYNSDYNKRNFRLNTSLKWKDTIDGYSYLVGFNAEQDIDHNTFTLDKGEMFLFGNYETNSALNIKNRYDIGFGLGFELYKDRFCRHKISYALIICEDRLLNSFRYKYKYNIKILFMSAFFNYKFPIEEFDSNVKVGLNIFKSLSLGLNFEYKSIGALDNYLANAFLKIKL